MRLVDPKGLANSPIDRYMDGGGSGGSNSTTQQQGNVSVFIVGPAAGLGALGHTAIGVDSTVYMFGNTNPLNPVSGAGTVQAIPRTDFIQIYQNSEDRNITEFQLEARVNPEVARLYAESHNQNSYNVFCNNCTDFVVDMLDSTNVIRNTESDVRSGLWNPPALKYALETSDDLVQKKVEYTCPTDKQRDIEMQIHQKQLKQMLEGMRQTTERLRIEGR